MIETTVPLTRKPGWQTRFPALAYPNYRIWFLGSMVAAFGMWTQSTAQGYLMFDLTQSPIYLGYVSFAGGVPTWLFMLYGGVVADRVPRRILMLMTQSCMMVLAFTLAVLTLTHVVQPWHILLLAFLLGVVNAFDAPARQAFVLEMVEREDLANAIALNATMFNTATSLGPAAAGLIYAVAGPGWCFLLNSLSFAGPITALLMMKLKPLPARLRVASVMVEMKEGLQYVLHEPTVRILVMLVGMTSLFGLSFATLIPAWAVQVMNGDETTNGLLYSARGFGALLGALWISSLGRFKYKGKLLTIGSLAMPVMIIIFAFVRWLPLSLLVLVATGLTFIPVVNLANALVQTLTPDHLRGRVMGIYTLIFMGMWPLGGLWVGTVAERFGEPVAVLIGGCVLMAFVIALYVFVPRLRALE
jgi:MFS family permease